MSGAKGVVNRSAKTSGKNNQNTNTMSQNANQKDAVTNKVHEKEKLQPTAEQLRIAKMIDLKPDDGIQDKVKQVMSITQKTEDEVVIALHDNGLDIALTIEALLEGPQESWSTTGKKKKNRASSVNKKEKEELKNGEVDGADGEWDEAITPVANNITQNNGGFNERRGRGRGGRGGYSNRPRPAEGQRYGESRRERENKENEKNLAEDITSGENRNVRSDSRGSRRGINGPRYNGRSRGTRMFQNSERGNSGSGGNSNSGFSQPIDTWFNPTAKEPKKENWGDTFPSPEDWDNEEYTGSLADTKVFTPSGGIESAINNEIEAPKPNENAYLEVEDWNDAVQAPTQQAAANSVADKLSSIANSKTLTPEQSQYLSSLTQESQLKKVVTTQPSVTTTFNSHPPVEFVSSPFEENSMGPGKKPTLRARIPPPSKIPLSAVEMPPDDPSVNINFLDVSFGAVDLSGEIPQLCEASQDQNALPPVKYDDSVVQKVDSVLIQTEYSAIANQAAVQSQRPPQVNQTPQPSTKIGPPPGVPPPADYLTKQNASAVNSYQNVNSGQQTSIYNSVYSNNPQGISSHSSLYGTTASNIGVNSTNPHIPQLSQSNHSILNANYPQTAAQPPFPSYSYPNPAHSYQASGISYPIVSAANLASMYTPSTYSNYIHQNLQQTGNANNLSKSTTSSTSTTNSTKDSLYEQSQTTSNSLTSTASNSTGNNIGGTTSNIGLAQSTLLTSKATTPTTNKGGVLSGMPPGVAPLVGAQYILSQQGIPGYYQSHPVMYSEEHLQMVQSRLPHHMGNFYSPDPMYPSVSSSLTGRDTAGAGISNVAGYSSLTDSRFARTDNNASPVPSTLSQQSGTLAHQQTLLNPPITPSYTYYYGQSVIPANPYQYGTMYPMAPAASATSHGTGVTNTMSGYNKTAAAPAGYNNVYETLGSSAVTGSSNDYGSSSKVGVSGQQTSQAQGKANSSDLAAMYSSKSTINKSYDKQQQSFQSPPPYSVTLNNGGVGGHHTGGSYTPVFISPMPPAVAGQAHHVTAPMHHQMDMRVQNRQGQELTNGTSSMNRNQSVNPTASKVNVKQNYNQGATPYWNSN